MAGIYIHIPFCKQACHYCNFHFSTSLRYKKDMIDAICREIDLRHSELSTRALQSIYFGGGTPSLLDSEDLDQIFVRLSKHFSWSDDIEITLEANPDDLTKEKIKTLAASPVNRLSIGVQSFAQADLEYMNRAHSSVEALRAILDSQDAGLTDLSVDLIYGSPTTDDHTWMTNVDQVISLDIPHISAYALTVEEGTALHHFINTGRHQPVNQNAAARQFSKLLDRLTEQEYEHYEISNFALAGKRAIHNSNYWMGRQYLGIGPAAHSFDGLRTRSWNISHNAKYISSISEDRLPIEKEMLSDTDAYNEYILIRLRTIWGVDRADLERDHSKYLEHFDTKVLSQLDKAYVSFADGRYTLTAIGKMLADKISMELFYADTSE